MGGGGRTRGAPPFLQLCPPWVSLEINILWACSRPQTAGGQGAPPNPEHCLGQRSQSGGSLRNNEDSKCLYVSLEFAFQAPAALVFVSSPMGCTATPGGEACSIVQMKTRTRSRCMLKLDRKLGPVLMKKVGWGSLIIHLIYGIPDLLE